MGILLAAGAFGGIYAAALAWIVVPTTGEMIILENKEHFSAWHRFLLFCCLPGFIATAGLIYLPESPRYLIEAGRELEAMMVYEKIFKKNNSRKTGTQYQLSELKIPTQRSRGMTPQQPTNNNDNGELSGITRCVKAYFKTFGDIFAWENLQSTVRMALIWGCITFTLHGLMWWCPEYLKHLQTAEYQTHRIEKTNEFHNYSSFTGPLENMQFRDSEFLNTKFSKMIFSHVDFINCELQFSRSNHMDILAKNAL